MNAPVTRRTLLGATAAVGAMSLPALAEAGIPISDPDAELSALLDLIARHADAEAVLRAAEDEAESLMRMAEEAYPPRPDALRPIWLDTSAGVDLKAPASGRERLPDGRLRGFYDDGDVEILRRAGPITTLAWDEEGEPPSEVPSPKGEARRREIVAAYDAWATECREIDRRTGYTAADDARAAAGRVYWTLDDAIRAHEVRTLAGLRAKAGWIAERSARSGVDETDDLVAFARQVAAFGGVAS